MTDGLITWFRAVLDEDEAAARPLVDGWQPPEDGLAIHEWRELRWRLADVAAKRALLDAHEEPITAANVAEEEGLIRAVRIVASAYSSRPGYRPEWRP